MNKKRQLTTILALSILTIYMMNIQGVSATPQSPYIAVVPSSNITHMGYNRTISIYTDYGGSDIWSWGIKLTFNKTLLQCVKVTNGDLITAAKDTSAEFHSKINNTIGTVSASALFYYETPPPFVTSGPGTLVKITFKGLHTGNSNLHLEKETKLQLFNATKALERGLPENEPFTEIGADTHPKQIGHGTAMISVPGDVNGDKSVNIADIVSVKNHWYPGPPTGLLGYDISVDINDDGAINIADLVAVKTNWGQSW